MISCSFITLGFAVLETAFKYKNFKCKVKFFTLKFAPIVRSYSGPLASKTRSPHPLLLKVGHFKNCRVVVFPRFQFNYNFFVSSFNFVCSCVEFIIFCIHLLDQL